MNSFFPAAALVLFPAVLAASGPGLPQESHETRYEVLSVFGDDIDSPLGKGFVTMHDGYLFVPFSLDGGGGRGESGFSFYDMSDPRNPETVFTTVGDPEYSEESGAHFVGDMREPHGYTISEGMLCMTMNDRPGNKAGIQFWDFTDVDGSQPGAPDAPERLSELSLTGVTGGDYDNTAWWVAWQGGRYAYVAGTNQGLFIVDATDPANPVELKRIPTGDLGLNRASVVHVIGNLMVLSNNDGATGLATYDISDPLNPQLLDLRNDIDIGYSFQLNDNRVLGANEPAVIISITDPRDMVIEGGVPMWQARAATGVFRTGVSNTVPPARL
jgi:hypothetical protein